MKIRTYTVSRESYRAWRAQCPAELLSELTKIAKWLGDPPLETSLPEPARLIAKPESNGGAAEKKAALLALLDEVDKRAAEQGAGFNRHRLPGTKPEFCELLKAYYPAFRYIGLPATADYLKGACKFQRGVQPKHGKGAAVWALFPEYHLKLG